MKKILLFTFLLIGYLSQAQYISEVLEYVPAPGQFINTEATGSPAGANKIIGGTTGTISLGAYGGYIVFRFENAVENDPENPFGVDFTIFGNAYANWSEPGAVYVMKDENENGLADDTWYLLAGSDYYFSSTEKNYELSYENPKAVQVDIPWTDNLGESGVVSTNTFHKQEWYPTESYFPSINRDNYTLGGLLLKDVLDKTNPSFITLKQRAFGYADNLAKGTAPDTRPDNPYTAAKENSGGDAFDISWAIDENGNYVDLESIHFVKVQTAVNGNGGWAGEVSTEIRGAVDVAADASISGETKLVVMKDMPATLTATENDTLHLEAYAFENGRLSNSSLKWYSDNINFPVEENAYVILKETGEVTFSVELEENTTLKQSAKTTITVEEVTAAIGDVSKSSFSLHPNPASDKTILSGAEGATMEVFSASGNLVYSVNNCTSEEAVLLNDWNSGMYILKVTTVGGNTTQQKLLVK